MKRVTGRRAFPGLRVTAATTAALSDGHAPSGVLLTLRPKLFVDLSQRLSALESSIVDDQKKLPLLLVSH
jgi:hypothetical protein